MVARLRGRAALQVLAGRAHVIYERRKKKSAFRRVLASYTRFDRLPIHLLMILTYLPMLFIWVRHRLSGDRFIVEAYRNTPLYWWAMLCGTILMVWQIVYVTSSREVDCAVRLWFRCCRVAGMKQEDIAVLTGHLQVVEISHYLAFEDEIDTRP